MQQLGLGKETYHVNGHFILFFFLGMGYFKATKKVWISLILGALYVLFNEFIQIYLPSRSFQIFDIYIGMGGVLISGFIIWRLQFILPKKLKTWLMN